MTRTNLDVERAKERARHQTDEELTERVKELVEGSIVEPAQPEAEEDETDG
jgi:hypothetical protein